MELVPGSDSDDVMATNPGVKLTYDDFVLFPDDGRRHELIDGEHYVTAIKRRLYERANVAEDLGRGPGARRHPRLSARRRPFHPAGRIERGGARRADDSAFARTGPPARTNLSRLTTGSYQPGAR